MKHVENWIRTIATVAAVVLILQWGWNQFFPLFGWPELNILQATGLFAVVFLAIACASIAWNSQKTSVPHFHYDVKPPKDEGQ